MTEHTLSISQRHEQIVQRLSEAYVDLSTLQEECTHPGLVGTYKADTGNWSRSDDAYWVEFRCPDCSKRWDEDQNDVRLDRVHGFVTKNGFPFKKV